MSVVASKKVGSSVLRNRAKRLLREVFRAASVINSASLTSLTSLKDAPNLADKSAGNYETEARLMSAQKARGLLCGYYALIAKNELLSLEFGQILKDLKWSLKKLNCQVL